jgi:hypothetical protein
MSKGGGAGKVYFVLYLAVVLELLIIIVERDEAEEHLQTETERSHENRGINSFSDAIRMQVLRE